MKKNPLGRGLDALLGDNAPENDTVTTVRLSSVQPNRDQPRKDFEPGALEELADSIRQHGVIQPLLVTETTPGSYMIIAGERRWRAARLAELTEIPVIIRQYTDREIDEIALIENLQRENLNPIEEACGYKSLMEKYGLTQEQVSERVGKPRPTVANSVRLLNLPEEIVGMLRDGMLTSGHGKVLLSVPSEMDALALARRAAGGKMSVLEMEKAKRTLAAEAKKVSVAKTPDPFYYEVEEVFKRESGRKCRISAAPKGQFPGKIEIEFFSKEDLAELARFITGWKRS